MVFKAPQVAWSNNSSPMSIGLVLPFGRVLAAPDIRPPTAVADAPSPLVNILVAYALSGRSKPSLCTTLPLPSWYVSFHTQPSNIAEVIGSSWKYPLT